MTFTDAVRYALQNYAVFTGRAGRSTFWYWVLFTVIVGIIANVIDKSLGVSVIGSLVSLGFLLPNIGMAVRRLHDIGKSWKWLLLVLIPVLGWIYLIYLYVQPSEGPNVYGTGPATAPTTAGA
ncbi:MAG: DUF805 domain-containing protein [Dehalococcoidia bacterium]|nr:MAG: DUF805 domain-containing protein [Dehalococcoidia bacterium]